MERYGKFLSKRSARRQPSAIRALQPLMATPGMISLGGGNPNGVTFPFKSASFELRDGDHVTISPQNLAVALQYSPSYGLPGFTEYLKNFQREQHHPPQDVCIVVSSGSQDLMCKAFDMLVDEGDYVLVESPTYPGALGALRPIGCSTVGVECDEHGLIPERLEQTLASWDPAKRFPRLLYLIPNGQNPSGASLTLERKKAIYALAHKWDLLILEDDPYYFLTYPTEPAKPMTPSLLSMDIDSRVIRLDSFSKIMSSGIRIGFATGHPFLIERLQLDMQVSLLHTSGLSQMLLLELLRKWGDDGWNAHVASVRFYKQRCDKFCELAEKHLGGKATWSKPAAGMFLWLRLTGVDDTKELIQTRALEKKVLLLPGQLFDPSGKPSPYVRASFSPASDADMVRSQ
eukprot:TRINITY_DN189_c0_g1_i2.p1 TRINITY_DN189_c0_g1~~TRINITY_DN189_c0_g1_i2.p1  ORF type:complete len:402 (-),score=135.41 TRINITY_DN189_c0_g1_i2:258-1463(-)